MDDFISRRAAIDAFMTELTKRERNNLLHTWSTVDVKYFVSDMLEKLPTAWQIFDVCPPEEDGVYIVTASTGEVFPAEYDAEGEEVGRLFIGTKLVMHWTDIATAAGLFDEEVTAWMELPEAFEG